MHSWPINSFVHFWLNKILTLVRSPNLGLGLGSPDLGLCFEVRSKELTIACTVDNDDPNHQVAFRFPLNSLDDRLY